MGTPQGAAAPAAAFNSGRPGNGAGPDGSSPQGALAECDRLRKELAEARDEVTRLRCQAEALRQEWFAAKLQEEEYRKYIRKLTGEDPYISLQELLEAEKSGFSWDQIRAEMEKEESPSSDEA